MFVHRLFGGEHDFGGHHVTETLEVDRRSFLRVEFGDGAVRQSYESVDIFSAGTFALALATVFFV